MIKNKNDITCLYVTWNLRYIKSTDQFMCKSEMWQYWQLYIAAYVVSNCYWNVVSINVLAEIIQIIQFTFAKINVNKADMGQSQNRGQEYTQQENNTTESAMDGIHSLIFSFKININPSFVTNLFPCLHVQLIQLFFLHATYTDL